MPTYQTTIHLQTKGHTDIIDITSQVDEAIRSSGIATGMVNISGVGSTLGITTIEYEPGCCADLRRALESIAPADSDYAHNARWGDNNGYAHLRSAVLGTAKTYPVCSGQLGLGTWQQIILCDFDDRPRRRDIIVTVCGD
ncbi:MAG: YjbQ family protein [Bryobacterales bacterium]|nr:YjbQ family protein [Bryobacterales bacterium]